MATPYSTVGGYGSSLPIVNPDGSALVDTEEGAPATAPAFATPTATTSNLVSATSALGPTLAATPGIPILNAVLIELRLIAEILNDNTSGRDLVQMRASILADINPSTGGW